MKPNRHMDNVSRVVVKIGTSSLMHANGKLNLRAIDQLSYTLTGLVNEGKQVILVSSGAIGAGMGRVGLTKRPNKFKSNKLLQLGKGIDDCVSTTICSLRSTN